MTYRKEFAYMKRGKMLIGWRHHFMTKGDRERFFASHGKLQKGRRIA